MQQTVVFTRLPIRLDRGPNFDFVLYLRRERQLIGHSHIYIYIYTCIYVYIYVSGPTKPWVFHYNVRAAKNWILGAVWGRLGPARHVWGRFWGRLGPSRPGPARLGPARPGSARLRSARPGPPRLGWARLGPARLGSALPLTPPGAKKVSKWLPAAQCIIHCKTCVFS